LRKFICFVVALALVMIFTSGTSDSISSIAYENTECIILDKIPDFASSSPIEVVTLEFVEMPYETYFYYDYKFFQTRHSFYDVDCIINTIFYLTDSRPNRFPLGRTGHYMPAISDESLYDMFARVHEAVNIGITENEFHELIYSIKEYQWNNYPLIFVPFSLSNDIRMISSFDGTIYFQRD